MFNIFQPTQQDVSGNAKSTNAGSALSFRLASANSDLPAILRLAQAAHEESRLGYIPFNPDKVRRIAKAAFKDQKRRAVMLAEKHDQAKSIGYKFVGGKFC